MKSLIVWVLMRFLALMCEVLRQVIYRIEQEQLDEDSIEAESVEN